MSRRCELTAKGPQVGHKVSHSNPKTKRRFLPNLVNVTFLSVVLGRGVRMRVSTNAVKSVDHRGGFDAYLIKAKEADLAPKMVTVKRQLAKKLAKTEAAGRFEETVGEYAAGAVRRFANLAASEDWLGLMNVIERADDPGIDCLTFMVKWSLRQDDAPPAPAHEGCTCVGNGGCS